MWSGACGAVHVERALLPACWYHIQGQGQPHPLHTRQIPFVLASPWYSMQEGI
jgi:hypothetical protein